jgi:hypothetical protein
LKPLLAEDWTQPKSHDLRVIIDADLEGGIVFRSVERRLALLASRFDIFLDKRLSIQYNEGTF